MTCFFHLSFDDSPPFREVALLTAATAGHLECVKAIIERNGLNAATDWGSSAVFTATRGGHWDIVTLLADNGANVYGSDGNGLVLRLATVAEANDAVRALKRAASYQQHRAALARLGYCQRVGLKTLDLSDLDRLRTIPKEVYNAIWLKIRLHAKTYPLPTIAEEKKTPPRKRGIVQK